MGLFDEFYDDLLQKVLSHPEVQKHLQEMREECPDWGEFELESDALDHFFSLGYEEIFSIDEIFEKLKEDIREEIAEITSGRSILADKIDFNLEDYVIGKLEIMRDELENALKRKHGKAE